ncbi:MAG: isochorismatase family cysteine hydrolase [Burkholderiales bacterium]
MASAKTGNAPGPSRAGGRCATVLLLVDFVNPMDFDGARALAPSALRAARAAMALKRRFARAGWPVIFANDNFGHWDSQFDALIAHCAAAGGAAARLVRAIAPEPGDLSLLKPRHSAFFGTPLDFLLHDLAAQTLVITGIAADSCVLFTALDAFVREYRVWVPNDCVAAESAARRASALRQLRTAAKVWTGPSTTPLRTAVARCAALHR